MLRTLASVSLIRKRHRVEPMKPAPPVTMILMFAVPCVDAEDPPHTGLGGRFQQGLLKKGRAGRILKRWACRGQAPPSVRVESEPSVAALILGRSGNWKILRACSNA